MGSAAPPGAHLYLEQEHLEPELRPLAGGLAAVCSVKCPGKTGANEDAAALLPAGAAGAVLVVADGLGGERAGAQASGLAVRCLAETLRTAGGGDAALRVAVLDGVERANEAVLGLGVGAATTLAAAEVDGGRIRPYHIGDSMVLVVGQRGRLKLQTVAHSPVGFAVEAGLLDELEAMHHDERHLVSNVLGSPDMRVEVGSALPLAPHDTVLLASDGLLDNLHLREIVERVRAGPLEAAARRLAGDAFRRMTQPSAGEPSKPDDLTFVLFRPSGR